MATMFMDTEHLADNGVNARVVEAARIFRKGTARHNDATSTFWLQKTDYLRLKNLQLGYTIPQRLTQQLGVSSVRVFYSAENLFTLDHMRGNIDPEATSARLSSYPLLRTHSFGLNVSF